MKAPQLEIFIKEFLAFIGKKGNILSLVGHPYGCMAHVTFNISPKEFYGKVKNKNSNYLISEYAWSEDDLPDFLDEKERIYNVMFFYSHCTRIRMTDQLILPQSPTKLFSIIESEKPQPIIIPIFAKREAKFAKLDFRIYESNKEEKNTVDLAVRFVDISQILWKFPDVCKN